MLRRRLIGAAAMIAPLLALLWMDEQLNFGFPGCWLALLGAALSVAAACEFIHLFQGQIAGLKMCNAASAALIFSGIASVPVFRSFEGCALGIWGWAIFGMLAALAYLLTVEIFTFRSAEGVTRRVCTAYLAATYAGLPFCFFLYTRVQVSGRLGLFAVFATIFVIKSSDAGAYFVGRSMGRRKLAPRISPGKTVEGAIGGLLVAALVSYGLLGVLAPAILPSAKGVSILPALAFGLLVAVVGILGDLSMSMFKRDAGMKDSASWLPGLGGMLDILDSVLWAAPVAYLFWAAGCFGPSDLALQVATSGMGH